MTSTTHPSVLPNPTTTTLPTILGSPAAAKPNRTRPAQPGHHPAAQGKSAAVDGRRAPLVLVAVDDPAARHALRRRLESAAYQVVEAADPEETFTRVSEDVGVVLLDLSMPGVSGTDCLRRIRARFADVQVIVISAAGKPRNAVAAFNEGACDYIVRPCDRDELLARVRQAAHIARLARDKRDLQHAVGYPVASDRAGCGKLAGMTLAQIERRALIETLQACGGNKAKTARQLAVSEKTIYNKIKRYNLAGIV